MPPAACPLPVLVDRRVRFRRDLQRWYRAHARPLPWRTAPSLYRTVVSEFMCQQTQISTVLPYFERWLRTLPDFAALAAAPEAAVLKLWEGLGYYSRARNLQRLARQLIARPAIPQTAADWEELPGIGPYTAAAITSITFGTPAACVDGNVVRLLARLTGDDRLFRDSVAAARHFAPLAAALLDPARPGDHNQAMMELGATICQRARPRCADCPVAGLCAARTAGDPATLPRFVPKRSERVSVARALCLDRGRLLLHRAAAGSRRLAGLHELPEAVDLGCALDGLAPLLTKRRAITRYQITESFYRVPVGTGLRRRIAAHPRLIWVPIAELAALTLSGPHRRWLGELLAESHQPRR